MVSTLGTGKLMETSKLPQHRLFKASRTLQGACLAQFDPLTLQSDGCMQVDYDNVIK